MKIRLLGWYSKASMFFLSLLLFQSVLLAQGDSGSKTVTVTSTHTESWYAAPWVWVVGGILLLILLIALFRGGGDKTTSTHTERVIVTKD